ncbi:formyl-CoA transferase [Bordetella genomosp. 10]|uniref:Formyl-CoA transferase n=1 Tax=Bordetella genomosp. 10 TaxID=1416804 RepID=A0A261S1P3_9BORD|nr:CoA transferase [Bordetella genomosp. 10]OZI31246.1 formyl-CoA transferase [Bordetella genomosp. 10]
MTQNQTATVDTPAAKPGALSGIRVLDLTRVRAGPSCVRQFADWGADVIKIESPEYMEVSDAWGGWRDGADFQNLHRNKRSLSLNMKDPRGLRIFHELVKTADVVAENFRPDVKFRLGIDYETLKEINPGIVYVSISGFGQDGPYARRPGFDHIVQGMGGMMSINGYPENGPTRVGIAVADTGAGLYSALGVMTALLERQKSGLGQWVQVSLLEAMIAMLDFQGARWLMEKEIPAQAGNNHPTSIPTGVYPTADGHVTIAAGEQAMFKRLAKALDREDWLAQPAFATEDARSEHRHEVNDAIAAITRRKSSAEWLEIFEAGGVAAGPIYRMNEVFADEQVRHLGIAKPLMHRTRGPIEVIGQPFSLSRTPSRVETAAPTRGEHNDEVLREIGYTSDAIQSLRQDGVI